ncbi:MAG: hypothetical protein L0312_29415, partial [Acidobacteria bacterium]|nr:hypothetical protein [Acidobacteriota bacterium]
VWLLTALFHDVGYPVQKRRETSELLYGVPVFSEERAVAERKDAWESPTYRTSRAQIVSLYEHLNEGEGEEWTADPFVFEEGHPFDIALGRAFQDVNKGHGVVSCMRMLADFFRGGLGTTAKKQFLAKHIFMSALSIPFHDWPVRSYLRESQIAKIQTSRFPFASLLMFVDSIQEDRRGSFQGPDLLTGVSIADSVVTAQMDASLLTEAKLREKKREVADVLDFLEQDFLKFQYPPELR